MTIRYITRRILAFFLTIFLAVTLNFAITRLTPVDPVTALIGRMASKGRMVVGGEKMIQMYRERFGLDKSLPIQYLNYLRNLFLYGDMGYSLAYFPAKAKDVIIGGIPWTLGLFIISTLIAFLIGNFMGAAATWPKTPKIFRVFVFAFMPFSAMPYYILAMILLYIFAIKSPIFPLGGSFTVGSQRAFDLHTIVDLLYHSALPAISIVLAVVGFWALSMRGTMTMVLGEDYLVYARTKGLKDRRIFSQYAIRNAFLPQVTALAIDLGRVISGQVLVETIFNYPGMGWILYNALRTADYFVIQGVVIFIVVSVSLATLIIDLIYPLLDPRIRYS